jgi:hypothetical protein
MRKLLLLSVVIALAVSSCKKNQQTDSTTETASFPAITITSGEYYSIPQYALYPNVTATATDSFYSPTAVQVVDSAIHTNVPGLYVGTVSARNKEGFTTYTSFYVAVTNISSALNLSGTWLPVGGFVSSDSGATQIQELANGLYSTSNSADSNIYTGVSVFPAIFAVTNDTTIVFPADNTNFYSPGTLSLLPGDTTITYYSTATGAAITYQKH